MRLSPIQQQVINHLMQNDGSYIYKSQHYNHNKVVSKDPFIHKYGFETRELMQFPRPTLTVLIRIGAIKELETNKNHYILAK